MTLGMAVGRGAGGTVAMRDALYEDRRANSSCLEGASADGRPEIESAEQQAGQQGKARSTSPKSILERQHYREVRSASRGAVTKMQSRL